jgi:transcriptional regulator with PAS, ATPase and Fis domain
MNDDENCITMAHLSEDLNNELNQISSRPQPQSSPKTENLMAMSGAMIKQAITSSAGNMSEAARRLGISRNTLYRRIKSSQPK